MKTSLAIVLAAATLTIGTVSVAQEQTLKGRLVVTQPTGTSTALPSYGGHTFNANKYSGVAVFEDGRVAYKQYIEFERRHRGGWRLQGLQHLHLPKR